MNKNFIIILALAVMIGSLLVVMNYYDSFTVPQPTATPVVVQKEKMDSELNTIKLESFDADLKVLDASASGL